MDKIKICMFALVKNISGYAVMICSFKSLYYRFFVCTFILFSIVGGCFGQEDTGWSATINLEKNGAVNSDVVIFPDDNILTQKEGFGKDKNGHYVGTPPFFVGERYAELIKKEKDINKKRLYYFEIAADDGFTIDNDNNNSNGWLVDRRYWDLNKNKLVHGSSRRVLIYLNEGERLIVNYFNMTNLGSSLEIKNFTKIEPKISEEGNICVEDDYKLYIDKVDHFTVPTDPVSYNDRLGGKNPNPLWIDLDLNGKIISDEEDETYGGKSEYIWHLKKIEGFATSDCRDEIQISETDLGEFNKHVFTQMLEMGGGCNYQRKEGTYKVILERKVWAKSGKVYSVFSEEKTIQYDGSPKIVDDKNVGKVEFCLPKISRAYVATGDVLNIEGDFVLEKGDRSLDVEIDNINSNCCTNKVLSWKLYNGTEEIAQETDQPSQTGVLFPNKEEDTKYTMVYEIKCDGKVVSSFDREIIIKGRPKLKLVN